jgi:hypothetical protein
MNRAYGQGGALLMRVSRAEVSHRVLGPYRPWICSICMAMLISEGYSREAN